MSLRGLLLTSAVMVACKGEIVGPPLAYEQGGGGSNGSVETASSNVQAGGNGTLAPKLAWGSGGSFNPQHSRSSDRGGRGGNGSVEGTLDVSRVGAGGTPSTAAQLRDSDKDTARSQGGTSNAKSTSGAPGGAASAPIDRPGGYGGTGWALDDAQAGAGIAGVSTFSVVGSGGALQPSTSETLAGSASTANSMNRAAQWMSIINSINLR